LFWNPHQKLWNQRLTTMLRRFPGGRGLVFVLAGSDSLLLAARVLARRASKLGLAALVVPGPLPERAIYVDCGLHKSAAQARLVSQWFSASLALEIIGVEASPDHAADARLALCDVPNVVVYQVALVGPENHAAHVRLYHAGRSGIGDSLFATRGETYDDVPARRLSILLESKDLDGKAPVIVRMNIEGAESFVISDLIDANLIDRVNGWYGMWDDLSKIDATKDEEFRAMMGHYSLDPVTFNQRDLKWPLRLWAIRYDFGTSLRLSQSQPRDRGWLRR